MSARVYAVCADVLMLAVKFPLTPSLPPPSELRQRMHTALDVVAGKGRTAGISEADMAEIRYALVAFIDEQIAKSNWPGRSEWMGQPLQLVLYNQFNAGEIFFVRMQSLLADGRRQEALAAYYLCLALGFRGQYGASGDPSALSSYSQAALQQLSRTLPRTDKLGPHAVPSERARKSSSSNAPLIAFIAGGLLIAVAVLVGLERLVHSDVQRTLDVMPVDSPTPGR